MITLKPLWKRGCNVKHSINLTPNTFSHVIQFWGSQIKLREGIRFVTLCGQSTPCYLNCSVCAEWSKNFKSMVSFHILETEINLHCATKFGSYLTENNMRLQYKGQFSKYLRKISFFHSCTAHLDTIKILYLPTDAQ